MSATLHEHIDLGFTHLYYHCVGPDQKRFLEEYGRDVLSALRQRAPLPPGLVGPGRSIVVTHRCNPPTLLMHFPIHEDLRTLLGIK